MPIHIAHVLPCYQKWNPSQNSIRRAYNLHKYQISFSIACQNMENTWTPGEFYTYPHDPRSSRSTVKLKTCMIFIRWPRVQELAVAVQLQGVAPSPGRTARATDGVVEFVALAEPAALAPGWRQPTHLSVLVDGLGDPLGVGVPPDGLMEGVDQDHFKELVSGIFSHPIWVQDSQGPAVTASTFLQEKINATGCKTMDAGHSSCRKIINSNINFQFSLGQPLFQ